MLLNSQDNTSNSLNNTNNGLQDTTNNTSNSFNITNNNLDNTTNNFENASNNLDNTTYNFDNASNSLDNTTKNLNNTVNNTTNNLNNTINILYNKTNYIDNLKSNGNKSITDAPSKRILSHDHSSTSFSKIIEEHYLAPTANTKTILRHILQNGIGGSNEEEKVKKSHHHQHHSFTHRRSKPSKIKVLMPTKPYTMKFNNKPKVLDSTKDDIMADNFILGHHENGNDDNLAKNENNITDLSNLIGIFHGQLDDLQASNNSFGNFQLNLTLPNDQDEDTEKRSFKSPKLQPVKTKKQNFPFLRISKHYRNIVKPVNMLSLTRKVLSNDKHSNYYHNTKHIRSVIPLIPESNLYELLQGKGNKKQTVGERYFNSIDSNNEVGEALYDKRKDEISALTTNKTTTPESLENLQSPSNGISKTENQRPFKPPPDLQIELVPESLGDLQANNKTNLEEKQRLLQPTDIHMKLVSEPLGSFQKNNDGKNETQKPPKQILPLPDSSGSLQNLSNETKKVENQRPLQLADFQALASMMLKSMPEASGYLRNHTNDTSKVEQQKPIQTVTFQTPSVPESSGNLQNSSNNTSIKEEKQIPLQSANFKTTSMPSSENLRNSSNGTSRIVEKQKFQPADKISALNKTLSMLEFSGSIRNSSNNNSTVYKRPPQPADFQTSSENHRNFSNDARSTVGNQRSTQPLDPQALAMVQVGYPLGIADSSGILKVGGDNHPALFQSVSKNDELVGNTPEMEGLSSQSNLLNQAVSSPEELKEISDIKRKVTDVMENEVRNYSLITK